MTTLLQMLLAFVGVMAFGITFTVLWCCWVEFVSDLWQAHVVRPREARRAHAAALAQIEADTSERLARLSAAYVEASKEIRRVGETQRWLNS